MVNAQELKEGKSVASTNITNTITTVCGVLVGLSAISFVVYRLIIAFTG